MAIPGDSQSGPTRHVTDVPSIFPMRIATTRWQLRADKSIRKESCISSHLSISDFVPLTEARSCNMRGAFYRGRHHRMRPVKKNKTHFGIPYDWTPADREVRAALQQCIDQVFIPTPTAHPWYHNIAVQSTRDFLGDLYAIGLIDAERSWIDLKNGGGNKETLVSTKLVNHAISRLQERLHTGLLALTAHGISKAGGILYYTDRVDRCLIYEYDLAPSQRAATIVPRAQIVEPNYLYDIDSAVADISPETRTSLKSAVVYGHKIVAHRNTIVHVDRRKDIDTAGPFIDSIILNEMLHSYLYEYAYDAKWDENSSEAFQTALDIGCGNGLLITSAAQNIGSLKRLIAVDPNVYSTACTTRNFSANVRKKRLISVSGIFSDFPYSCIDLAICNPPYIPRRPGHSPPAFLDAVLGTQLLTDVILAVPHMLTSRGLLFLIFSNLANREYEKAVDQSKVAVVPLGPPNGFRVRFEQPTILRDPDQRDYLLNDRGLEYSEKTKEYHHTLRCVAIRRSDAQEFDGSSKLLQRLTALSHTLKAD